MNDTHIPARDAVSLYDDVMPARDAGIQFSLPKVLPSITQNPYSNALLVIWIPVSRHWNDTKEATRMTRKRATRMTRKGAGMKGVLDKATCITVAHP
uniref:Uncharacterized protein n=1 Tax=Wolbachia endosymbiont of Oeneis ivallda TaxID=3171168 RepID=A0AAU7YMP1_9RICK